MTRQILTTLPYAETPLDYFATIKECPGAILLDSGRPRATSGRFDILSSDPRCILTVDDSGIHWSGDVPDALLQETDPLVAQQALLKQFDITTPITDLPFTAGLLGFWSYDASRLVQQSPRQQTLPATPPWVRVGFYDWALVLDHDLKSATLVCSTEETPARVAKLTRTTPPPSGPFYCRTPFQAQWHREQYGEAFRRVQDYLRAGDCYQINLTQRFSAHVEGDSWRAYCQLRHATPTPFAGYTTWENGALLSLSPERFLQCHHGELMAQPIKGTRPRGESPTDDTAQASALMESLKDRAENVMIVDLLRNDLGRVCTPGSVMVPELMALHSFPNVHHLVSTVTGTLAPEHTPLDALMAAFPGGSITGAPKHRAVEIIDELEPVARTLYCGSLGYVDVRGSMDTSIMIRTAVIDGQQMHLWGGGGIVADSDEQEEFDESIAKIRHLMAAVETCAMDGKQ
ncbi:aminodeoxychorismate synthase component I [Larsenimonas rhizosphaerae]|uniref:aminodeoxychorismate synthase n=1 Tax=Larsenimonas rhizosphaerae TaxID=2944682 RepID=A0AA42CY21_9GAMM|nr:aminodeoxychorismate synthase component I [Larsenimonas rhizosphaerae]MCX2524588.1 aminodeoxychorismate synthase component I [Larsenimonas rhizosphaerae]